jgi:hypothetical protein
LLVADEGVPSEGRNKDRRFIISSKFFVNSRYVADVYVEILNTETRNSTVLIYGQGLS